MCIKCWCGMMESSNLDCLSSLHSHSTSILNPKCSILHPPTSNLFYPTSILHRHIFFLYPNRIFYSKCPQNSGISDQMSASAACTTCNFFQVCLEDTLIRWTSFFETSLHFLNIKKKLLITKDVSKDMLKLLSDKKP